MTHAETAGGILTIDLDAIVANWRELAGRLAPGAQCAAVVKADAYGLGVDRVAPALAAAGCQDFFVATVDEGVALRAQLPAAVIHAFNGLMAGTEALFAEHTLTPVLNSLGQIDAWTAFCRVQGRALTADVHVDTAMSRLGLPADEIAVLAADPARLDGLKPGYVLSHLACAEVTAHPLNAAQLTAFRAAQQVLPQFKGSLANGSGIFLGPEYHTDLARPGAALYGINPTPDAPNPMRQVVRLQGKILQVRSIDTPNTVGYGATHAVKEPTRVATLGVGYADGYLRAAGNETSNETDNKISKGATGFIGEVETPLVGRVSMDLISVDVTDVPASQAQPGALVDLIGPLNPVDDLAAAAGTIGYEVLTRLGHRVHRVYEGGTP